MYTVKLGVCKIIGNVNTQRKKEVWGQSLESASNSISLCTKTAPFVRFVLSLFEGHNQYGMLESNLRSSLNPGSLLFLLYRRGKGERAWF